MVIVIDEKLLPPPPYASSNRSNPFTSRRRVSAKFSDLPSHILLHVVYACLLPQPSSPSVASSTSTMSGGRYHDHDPLRDELVAQRRVLYWMVMNLRLTNRRMYMAAMNVLRSVYLPSYQSHVRPGYSSDPFPLSSLAPLSDRERRDSASTTSSKARSIPDFPLEAMSLASLQRETAVFDMYIAAKAREDMWLDETELHVEREETFTDLFEFNQPRARLEDLIRHYGTRSGSVSISLHPSTPTTSSPSNGSLPFTLLSISFSQRKAGLVRADEYGRNKRTIVAVERRRDDTLERVAKRLVGELDRLRSERRCYGG